MRVSVWTTILKSSELEPGELHVKKYPGVLDHLWKTLPCLFTIFHLLRNKLSIEITSESENIHTVSYISWLLPLEQIYHKLSGFEWHTLILIDLELGIPKLVSVDKIKVLAGLHSFGRLLGRIFPCLSQFLKALVVLGSWSSQSSEPLVLSPHALLWLPPFYSIIKTLPIR
jgi:hypothetical protein